MARSMTRLNRMFPRVVAARYPVPSHLSPEVCDLISDLIHVDPHTRHAPALALPCRGALPPRHAQRCEYSGCRF